MTNYGLEPATMGYIGAGIVAALLAVLALRLAEEKGRKPRNHMIVFGGALMAFGLVIRLVDTLANPEEVRLSSIFGSLGVLIFMAADQKLAERYSESLNKIAGLKLAATFVERRNWRAQRRKPE